MEEKIIHRRLYAFFNSKALNMLMLICVLSLTQIGYLQSMLLPVSCASVAFALFIGYSLWIWIKKPERVIIDTWLSSRTIWFTLYFLVIVNFSDLSVWWYILPLVAAIILLFVSIVRPHDRHFDI